jgi:hypothetical protein
MSFGKNREKGDLGEGRKTKERRQMDNDGTGICRGIYNGQYLSPWGR